MNVASVSGSSSLPGSSLSYFIAGGNTDSTFRVDDDTGRIHLRKTPDREFAPTFALWLEVRDVSVIPPLSQYAAINIEISDANDNPPVFDRTYYNASLDEGQDVGVTVASVTASDRDDGDNARLSYDLIAGDENEVFHIDANGDIRTNKELDREKQDKYQLVIRASDHVSLWIIKLIVTLTSCCSAPSH